MTRNTYRLALIAVAVLGFVLGYLLSEARAEQIERADRNVGSIRVAYVEPMPTATAPNRAYFETNDGATYVYRSYKVCAADGAVPRRVCRTVFFYAR